MINLNDNQRAIILLDSIEMLEYKRKTGILSIFSEPKELFGDFSKIEKYFKSSGEEKYINYFKQLLRDKELIESMIEKSVTLADGVICISDDDYPEELRNTPVPPFCLYYRGNKLLLKKRKLAMVGSRKTLPQYLAFSEDLAERISGTVCIVTGIAEGADTSAIKGGLKTGNIISVLAGGLDCIFPRSQINLAEEVAKQGLLMTEYPFGRVPKNYTYPVRNRIIAGLSSGVLIISGKASSGAKYTADYAVEYGKEVFCLPYGLNVFSGELCKNLLKMGAVLIESAEEIADSLGIELRKTEIIDLTDDEKLIYGYIKNGISNADLLIEKCELPIFAVNSALSMLEIKKVIKRDSEGNFDIIKGI